MKVIYGITALLFSLCFSQAAIAQSQPAKTIAFSGIEGAITGAVLGAGTMALKNDGEVDPLRIGVGAGALYGIGSGIYDVATMGRNQQTVYGLLTNGPNSAAIVLTDTFYGGVVGVILGGAIVMISGEKFSEGLRNGVGAGVWTGFGFGLIDAYLVKRNRNIAGMQKTTTSSPPFRAAGLVAINPLKNLSIGTLSPQLYNDRVYEYRPEIGLNMINMRVRF